jgi:hypothetical protein
MPFVGLRETIAGAFSFLWTGKPNEERVAQYVIREHRRGRSVGEIVDDPYVRNRLSTQQIDRMLERPEVLRAIGEDDLAALRAERGLI